MSRIRSNSDLHTSQADSERLVLQVLASPTLSGHKVTLPLSALGYYVKQAGILVLENAAATDSSAASATP